MFITKIIHAILYVKVKRKRLDIAEIPNLCQKYYQLEITPPKETASMYNLSSPARI